MRRSVTALSGVPSRLALLWAACSVACGAAPPRASAPAAPSATSSGGGCAPLPPRERTRELSIQARAELDASRDGEHFASERFEPAMARLREAALGGERAAQAVYGQTRFATLFESDAPRPDQREAYVEALTFWRTAELAAARPDTSGIAAAAPGGLEFPFSELPDEWLRAVWARADAWIGCHGLPW